MSDETKKLEVQVAATEGALLAQNNKNQDNNGTCQRQKEESRLNGSEFWMV